MNKLLIFLVTTSLGISTGAAQNDYNHKMVMDKVFLTLEDKIANPNWLEDVHYVQFKERMLSDKVLSLPIKEYLMTFEKEKQILPFTHLELIIKKNNNSFSRDNHTPSEPYVSWKEINNNTAYLDINQFMGEADEMYEIITSIKEKKYENLIIDLRGNGGGRLDAAVVLVNYLTNKTVDAGVFLTRKWYKQNKTLPSREQIENLHFLTNMTYEGVQHMYDTQVGFRMVLPNHDNEIFAGQVYILVDRNTGSTCEVLVYEMKKCDNVTIVGEKTAGAMLSGFEYKINEEYALFLPNADHVTREGVKIDKNGVEPDIFVDGSKALDYTLLKVIK